MARTGSGTRAILTGSVLFFTISSNLSFGSIHFFVSFAFLAKSSKSNPSLPRAAHFFFFLGPLYSKRDMSGVAQGPTEEVGKITITIGMSILFFLETYEKGRGWGWGGRARRMCPGIYGGVTARDKLANPPADRLWGGESDLDKLILSGPGASECVSTW